MRRKQLPYLDSIRLDIEQNPEIEALRYKRDEIHLINTVSPAIFEKLFAENAQLVRDAGPSTDSEQLWFNRCLPLPSRPTNWRGLPPQISAGPYQSH